MDVNEVKNKTEDEIEIDLLDLLFFLWSRLWFIILITIMLGAATFAYSNFFMTKYYESSTTIWVMGGNSSDSSSSSITYSDIQINTQMANDYINIITSRYVLGEVIDQLGLDETEESLSKRISTEIIDDTRMIVITVKDSNPEMAQKIADLIFDVASERIVDVIKLDNLAVTRVDEASLPTEPSSPNVTRNTVIGAAAGAFLSIALLIILYMMDDTIKTDEDIVKYLGYSVLASIPEADDLDDCHDSKKKKKSKRSKSGSKDKKSSKNDNEER